MRPKVPLPTGTVIGAPVERNRAHHPVAELLLHLQCQFLILELQGVIYIRNRLTRKGDVHDGTDDLRDFAFGHFSHALFLSIQTAAAPPTISESSLVIAAWRALL
jgi:hypothetical protein